jgi:uncharacterized membrane protein YhaH (DUF805 family)
MTSAFQHYKDALNQYADFKTRATRAQYWYFTLFNTIFVFILSKLDEITGSGSATELGILSTVFVLAVLIPSLAINVRRLHDTGKSGWWILINAVPLVGFFVYLYFLVSPSQPAANKYGALPKV